LSKFKDWAKNKGVKAPSAQKIKTLVKAEGLKFINVGQGGMYYRLSEVLDAVGIEFEEFE